LVHIGTDKDGNKTIHDVLDDGSAGGEYSEVIDPLGPDAKLIVTSVNARPKVEELVKAGQFKRNAIIHDESPKFIGEWIAVPREDFQRFCETLLEVEAALGGKAELDLEAHERDLERRAGCGDV
jgi:hypothetical protein